MFVSLIDRPIDQARMTSPALKILSLSTTYQSPRFVVASFSFRLSSTAAGGRRHQARAFLYVLAPGVKRSTICSASTLLVASNGSETAASQCLTSAARSLTASPLVVKGPRAIADAGGRGLICRNPNHHVIATSLRLSPIAGGQRHHAPVSFTLPKQATTLFCITL
jgi:hypothetical protein